MLLPVLIAGKSNIYIYLMISEIDFLKNLEVVRERIHSACSAYGRSKAEVSLLPVTKNWPSPIVEYCKRAGFYSVGENRVQEAIDKMKSVDEISWELIGHLQSNKVKSVVGHFARIQTVDSLKIIEKLHQLSSKRQQVTKVLLQVNISVETKQNMVVLPTMQKLFSMRFFLLEFLEVEGLMTIAPYAPENLEIARRAFMDLRKLRDDLQEEFEVDLPELSMGMSMDLIQAIEAGSTMIRIDPHCSALGISDFIKKISCPCQEIANIYDL